MFDLDKENTDDGFKGDGDRQINPVLIKTTKNLTFDGQASGSKVTCLAVDESLGTVAAGFDNGSLVLLRGELSPRSRAHKKYTLLKPRSLTRVVGVSFKTVGGGMTWLYVATSEQVIAFNATQMDKLASSK